MFEENRTRWRKRERFGVGRRVHPEQLAIAVILLMSWLIGLAAWFRAFR